MAVSKWLHAFKRRLSAALLIKRRPPSPPPLLHAPDEDDQTPNKTDVDDNKFLKVFQQLDRDGDGKLSSEELEAYFVSVGEPMAHEEARRVVLEYDGDGDGFLGFEEFVGLMEEESDDDEMSMKMAFEMYAVKSGSGSGNITAQGVQRMLGRLLGVRKTNEECADMIQAFDLDGNGLLDFNEFKLMMMT